MTSNEDNTPPATDVDKDAAKNAEKDDFGVFTSVVIDGNQEGSGRDPADLLLPVVVREQLHVGEVEVEGPAHERVRNDRVREQLDGGKRLELVVDGHHCSSVGLSAQVVAGAQIRSRRAGGNLCALPGGARMRMRSTLVAFPRFP